MYMCIYIYMYVVMEFPKSEALKLDPKIVGLLLSGHPGHGPPVFLVTAMLV